VPTKRRSRLPQRINTDVHANVTAFRPPISNLNPSHSLNILPGSTPYVRQPHTPSANAITQSS